MRSLWGYLLIICVSILTSCKTRHENYTETQAVSNNTNALSFTSTVAEKDLVIKVTSLKESEVFSIEANALYASQSPLSIFKMTQFDEITNTSSAVLDMRKNGSLYAISKSQLKSSCFAVNMYSLLMASNIAKTILISSLSKKSLKLKDGKLIASFQYCEDAKHITFSFTNEKTTALFFSYVESRGLHFVKKDKEQGLGFFEIKSAKVKKEEISEIEIHQEHVIHESHIASQTHLIPEKEPVTHVSEDSLQRQVSKPFSERITENANADDFKIFESMKVDFTNESDVKILGEGGFATAYLIHRDGVDYVVRVEAGPSIHEPGHAEWVSEKLKERMNFLAQNEFARVYPEAGFLKSYVSFVDVQEGLFTTVCEYKAGGELLDAIYGEGKGARNISKLMADIDQQIAIYQKGVPIELNGEQYTMHFVHRDIKPSNIILNADGTHASLIDFGLSEVILEDAHSNFKTYTLNSEGKIDLGPLSYTGKDLSIGTPEYMSPETIIGGSLFENLQGWNLKRNVDNYAYTSMAFFAAFKKHLFEKDLGEDVNIVDLFQWTMKSIPSRFGGAGEALRERVDFKKLSESDEATALQYIVTFSRRSFFPIFGWNAHFEKKIGSEPMRVLMVL